MPGHRRIAPALAVIAALGLPAVAGARPADVTIVNTEPIPVSGTVTARLDPAQNTVRVDGPVEVAPQTPFHRYAESGLVSAGSRSCKPLSIPAGQRVRLEAFAVTTFSDASPTAYLRYLARTGNGLSRVLVQHLTFAAPTQGDPVSNTRSGLLELPLHFRGGTVFDVELGEAHSPAGCYLAGTSSGQAFFTLSGYVE